MFWHALLKLFANVLKNSPIERPSLGLLVRKLPVSRLVSLHFVLRLQIRHKICFLTTIPVWFWITVYQKRPKTSTITSVFWHTLLKLFANVLKTPPIQSPSLGLLVRKLPVSRLVSFHFSPNLHFVLRLQIRHKIWIFAHHTGMILKHAFQKSPQNEHHSIGVLEHTFFIFQKSVQKPTDIEAKSRPSRQKL